jgi:hypothetical protein
VAPAAACVALNPGKAFVTAAHEADVVALVETAQVGVAHPHLDGFCGLSTGSELHLYGLDDTRVFEDHGRRCEKLSLLPTA